MAFLGNKLCLLVGSLSALLIIATLATSQTHGDSRRIPPPPEMLFKSGIRSLREQIPNMGSQSIVGSQELISLMPVRSLIKCLDVSDKILDEKMEPKAHDDFEDDYEDDDDDKPSLPYYCCIINAFKDELPFCHDKWTDTHITTTKSPATSKPLDVSGTPKPKTTAKPKITPANKTTSQKPTSKSNTTTTTTISSRRPTSKGTTAKASAKPSMKPAPISSVKPTLKTTTRMPERKSTSRKMETKRKRHGSGGGGGKGRAALKLAEADWTTSSTTEAPDVPGEEAADSRMAAAYAGDE